MILGEWGAAAEHLRAEKLVSPTADLINAALGLRSELIIPNCDQNPDLADTKRTHATEDPIDFAIGVASRRERWGRAIPETSPARDSPSPLIFLLAQNLDYADTEIVFGLPNGIPIAWPVAPAKGLSARKRQAQMSYQQWKREFSKRNETVIERAPRTQGADLALEMWDETVAEVSAGRATEPVDLSDIACATTL